MTAIRHSLILVPGVALLLTVPLGASSVVPVDFARLSQLADHVVGGRITEVTASRDADTGYIYSNVKVLVSHSSPGEWVGQEYSFRMIGGELDGKSLYIADFPSLTVDDSVVLFLNDQPASVFGPTVGLWQGVFFIESDAAGRETVSDHLRRPILGVREKQLLRGVRPTGEKSALTGEDSAPPALGIDEFFQQVQAHRGVR